MKTVKVTNRMLNLTSTLGLKPTTPYKFAADEESPTVFISEGANAEDALRQPAYALRRCLHILTGAHGYDLWAYTGKKWETAGITVTET